ncbi:P-loop containing nucleoside triphosphate hydrolase protein [Aspergillus violaceofuscus CBS 115571]|uniref:P-loop containing nucleoside triphosphate hydrolase protein n=1 Tax=Aspergillus violaceofuscus (strain CBS 115571) TaxID=1450538 RepID=A0A2V5HRF2_ASPV1|nr:P-loop containing nucleoside triphosphate hydrolase protein [Aspergillus violaceofuscus CBS 115571]
MDFRRISRIYVIGAPGAGKGSLCAKLAADFGFHHLSVGDLLRQLARSSSLKPKILSKIQQSVLLDMEDLAPILRDAIADLRKDTQDKLRLLIDGVPRMLEQAAPIEEAARMPDRSIGSPDLVLFFDCPGALARQRFLTRQLPGRVDDGSTFDTRYQQYYAENMRIVAYYERRGVLVKVDTSGDVDCSYARLLQGLASCAKGSSEAAEASDEDVLD